MQLKCVYCDSNPPCQSEHVFPKSLGGESIYMDCICDQCNNRFSALERELYQKSLVGLMRSSEGIEGYWKNKKRPAPLKFPETFQTDEINKIVYEVGVHNGFVPYIRPQFIKVDDKIFCESSSKEELESFIKVFNKWRHNNLIMIVKFPFRKGEEYEGVKFNLKDDKFVPEIVKVKKVKDEIIHYLLMNENDEFIEYFQPRMFIDDSNEILVRSRTIDEGVQFMTELLNYCQQETPRFVSFPKDDRGDNIRVSMKFNFLKSQQALVKIGLNALMHHYPGIRYNGLLRSAKNFVLTGTETIKCGIDNRNDLLDARQDTHLITFHQTKEGVVVRMSLFVGQFIYFFLINDLVLFVNAEEFSGVEIDFKNKKQYFYSADQFILRRLSDINSLKEARTKY